MRTSVIMYERKKHKTLVGRQQRNNPHNDGDKNADSGCIFE